MSWSFNFRFDINFKELIQIFANSVFTWMEPWPQKSPRIQISINSKSPFLSKTLFIFLWKKSPGGRKYQGQIPRLDPANARVLNLFRSLCSDRICDLSWGYYQYGNFGNSLKFITAFTGQIYDSLGAINLINQIGRSVK